MVHVRFDPTGIRLDGHFQVGGGHPEYFQGLTPYQRGHGFFVGIPRQRGAGLGDVFRRFWRILKPIAKSLGPVLSSAGKAVGEEGLAAGARVLNDVVQGGDLKQSVLNEGKEGVRNLLGRAERKLVPQRGGGRKRGRKSFNKIILKPNDAVGRLVPAKAIGAPEKKNKRKRIDVLGAY
jgi:hypothetical protein